MIYIIVCVFLLEYHHSFIPNLKIHVSPSLIFLASTLETYN